MRIYSNSGFLRWLLDGWYFWLPIVSSIIVFRYALFAPRWAACDAETPIRLIGWLVQLVGLGFGFRAFHLIRAWLKSLLGALSRPKQANLNVTTEAPAGIMKLIGHPPTLVVEPVPSDHDRIERLEATVRKLDGRLTELKAEVADKTGQLAESAARDRNIFNQALQQLDNKLQETAISGLTVATAGLIWIAFGMTFATIPRELANIFGCG